jgi:serine/threonine protein kinase
VSDDALPSSLPLPDLVGGRYRIVSRLGVGGMGVVYKAVDIRLNRPVAVKALEDRRVLMAGSAGKLRTEALAAASLDHPYICKVYELVETPTETFIVMEFVEGETLASMMKRGVLPLLQTLQFGREIAEGLANAHARGLVHRDVKPSNVMVTTHGHVKLLDFGVAAPDIESTPGEQTRTITPQITVHAGTPLYMAPEQAAGQPVTARADLFSLGVLLYECLTGALPFSGTTTFDYVRNMMQSAPRRLDRVAPNTPADLVDLVERCLEKSPAARPASADVVVAELRKLAAALTSPEASVRTAGHVRSGRAWKAVAALALAAATIAVGWQFVWPRGSIEAPLRQLRPFVTSAAQEFGSQISPDGQWVSFISTSGGGSQVMVQRVDGGEPRPLTLGQGTPISQIWSPDGRQLACVLKVHGTFALQVYPAFFGGAPQQTATLPAALNEVRLLRWVDRTIYFQANDAVGVSLRRIGLDSPEAPVAAMSANWTLGGTLRSVDVSPDGRAAAVAVSKNGQEDLWTVDMDGSALRALTRDAFFDRVPVWNGRGDRIMFQSNRAGQMDLWEIDPRTTTLTQLTSGEMEKIAESTSRDGSLISFQRTSNDAKLWTWGLGDTAGQQLTQDALSDYSPALAETGRVIAFQRSQPTPSRGYAIVDAKLLVAPFDGRAIAEGAQFIADGFAASLSNDGGWLAYLQTSDRAARHRLQVRHLSSGTTTTLAPYAEGPVLSSFPVDWASRMMAWSRTGEVLFFVDHPDVAAVRRYRAGQAEADPPLVRLASPDAFIRDLYPSSGDLLLGYLTVSRKAVVLSALTLATGATRSLVTLDPSFSGVYGRGWLGDRFILVRTRTLHEDLSADIEVLSIEPSGAATAVGVITNAFIATTRLHAARRALYVTRIENGVHNVYEFAFSTGALKALTRNVLPGVTFSGFQPAGADRLVGSRQERRQDIWLIQESAKERPGNPAGR